MVRRSHARKDQATRSKSTAGHMGLGFRGVIWGLGTTGCFSKIRGTVFGGPNDKDDSVLGSILGFPLFWETTWLRFLSP